MKKLFSIALLSVFLFSCEKEEEKPSYPSLTEFLNSRPDLSIFNAAINKAGLETFKDNGPFTWFIPNNNALLSRGITLDSVNRTSQGLASYFVTYHLLRNLTKSTDMVAYNSVPRSSQQGTQFFVGGGSGSYFINGTKVIDADNNISSGLVHVIDRFNTPPNLIGNVQTILSSSGKHSLFIAALTRTNRWAQFTGSTFTVVAPTDSAMTASGFTASVIAGFPLNGQNNRLDSAVRYHYFNSARYFSNDLTNRVTNPTALGSGRTIQCLPAGKQLKGKTNATPIDLTATDILGTNGVVHFIDKEVLKY
jgi:uncharacterized surface protein with fasciclin (FAS1) repeats